LGIPELVEPAVLLQGVEVVAGHITALATTSLVVERGERVAVVGPSGSGKTTLLACIAGISVPSAGVVRTLGKAVSSMSERERSSFRRSSIGMVFQDPELLDELTCAENVALPLLFRGTRRSNALEQSTSALERCGLSSHVESRVATLSGGEAQRVAIARALITDAPLILADEPTASLDVRGAEAIADLLLDVTAQNDGTLVVATHDQMVAGRCDRIVELRHIGVSSQT
jgi:ABC-type lipoprotein export system ATPase subunit